MDQEKKPNQSERIEREGVEGQQGKKQEEQRHKVRNKRNSDSPVRAGSKGSVSPAKRPGGSPGKQAKRRSPKNVKM
ncbi:MAG: hypothetical protein DMG61_01495 [Acidobacteria bacterium]|nr:MAG: hypothetical protein DMG61_01495 [Acidobacteriota bacterium]